MSEHQPSPEREPEPRPKPRIWIGSLSDYNAGRLHGEWFDAAVSDDELYASLRRILETSPEPDAEEWAIFDSDEFGAYRVGEHDQLERVAQVARGIAEHGWPFAAWAELHDGDPGMLDSFEDSYMGEYESTEAWAEEVLGDLGIEEALGKAAPHLLPYISIDFAGWARDAQMGGDVHIESSPDGGIYVFSTS